VAEDTLAHVRTIPYGPFDPEAHHALDDTGWDAWAEEYAQLPRLNAAYRFTKQLLYDVVDREAGGRTGLRVLDFNCGCGNDVSHFLAAGHWVVGCDGSAGMLSVAARRHAEALASGTVRLFLGRAEDLRAESFGGARFDLIFSATGGMAYLEDDALQTVHRALVALLEPGGSLVVTHLLPGCLIESAYYALQLRPRAALRRWRRRLEITVKAQPLTMHLRGLRTLRRLLEGIAPSDRIVALNVLTPPFQTGFTLPKALEPLLGRAERLAQRMRPSAYVSDQIAWVHRAPRPM